MRKALLLFLLLISACHPAAVLSGDRPDVLLQEVGQDLDNQRFEAAMEKGLRALEIARGSGDRLGEVKALQALVGIDIMASRDGDAWEKALEAEAIARDRGFRKELSGILVSKAKLCSYAEISPETGRNDEGLAYAREALVLAEETEAIEQQCEACLIIGSLYINKNRWSDPIDPDIYRTAGEWLDRGQALCDSCDLPRLRRNGILFRSRWFQQGGRNEEAILHFEHALSSLKDSDHLTASALDDRLVRLYTRTGAYGKALDAHDDYVFHIQKYILQKQDERSRYQVWLLALALLLALAVIVQEVTHIRKVHRRNNELRRVNDAKEELIQFLAKDLKNPVGAMAREIADLSAAAPTLRPEEIRARCDELARNARSINADVASYVGDVLVRRSERIADIGLTQREIQIIRLSAEGLTAAQIAERTFLSVHTVNTHRQHIYAKMEVRNVSDMLRKAQELGII